MKYVAPMAAAAGEDLRQTATALGVLANNGIKGSMAGTALARAYKNLAKEKTHKILEGIGVNAVDAAGNLRPVADIIQDIGKATDGMGSADKLAVFEEVFGRGSVGAQILSSAKSFKQMAQNLDDVNGVAARTAAEMDSGLGGAFRRAWSSIEGTQIAIGEALTPTLIEAAKLIADVALKTATWVDNNRGTVVIIGKVVAGAIALGGTLMVVGQGISMVGSSLSALSAISAATGMSGMAMVGAFAGLAAIVVVAGALAVKLRAIAKEANDLYATTRKMENSAKGKSNQQVFEMYRAFRADYIKRNGTTEGMDAEWEAKFSNKVNQIHEETGALAVREKEAEEFLAKIRMDSKTNDAVEKMNGDIQAKLDALKKALENTSDQTTGPDLEYERFLRESVGESMAKVSETRIASTSGIFNSRAVQSLAGFANTLQERIGAATEETSKNTKRLAKSGLGMAFT
jgi:hypothetical protein